MNSPFAHLNLPCHARKSCAPCDCSDAEVAIRYYASPKHAMAPMNPAQRIWCTEEIRRFDPPSLPGEDCADDVLARAVLKAWSRSVRF